MTKLYSPQELNKMDHHELVHLALSFQHSLNESKIEEASSSAIHNYHFTSNEILRLNADRYLGSAVIIAMFDLKGKPLFKPTSIVDGLSNNTINCLLDDLQRTFDHRIEFKPTNKRLK